VNEDFRLLMISAMYENGGNTTHRLLDGHPELFVYPFESQLGTAMVHDPLTSMFPVKYRWPVFPLEGTGIGDYRSIIDEECKVRSRTPQVSKFRHMAFDFSDEERCTRFQWHINAAGRSRANNVAVFFRATFEAWKNRRASGREAVYVGYSPIVAVDADKILADFPKGHVLHVVRNPWSAYADHKKRPVPLSLGRYLLGWALNQHLALQYRTRFPGRFHILRLEDILANPVKALTPLCRAVGVGPSRTLGVPTWNGRRLSNVAPWGTIRRATPAANLATALELGAEERAEVRAHAAPFLGLLGYTRFIK
jgi:hypothetical protein